MTSAPPFLCTQGFNPALLFQGQPSSEHTELLLQCLALQELPESCKPTESGLNTSCSSAQASCTAEHLFHSPSHTGTIWCSVSECAFMFFSTGFTLSGPGPFTLGNQYSSSSSDLHYGGLKAASSSPTAFLGWAGAQGMRADNGTENGAHQSPAEQAGHGRQFSSLNKSKNSDLELYLSSVSSQVGLRTGRDSHLPQQQ